MQLQKQQNIHRHVAAEQGTNKGRQINTYKDKDVVTVEWRYINSLRSILVCGSQHFPEARKLPTRIYRRVAAADTEQCSMRH